MIPEWFQMSFRHLVTTIFDAGKLKPKYLFKKMILWKSKIILQDKCSFFKKSRIFIKKNYSFFLKPEYSFKKLLIFWNPEYSFETNIQSFLKEAVSPRATIATKQNFTFHHMNHHCFFKIMIIITAYFSIKSWGFSRLASCWELLLRYGGIFPRLQRKDLRDSKRLIVVGVLYVGEPYSIILS